MRTRTKLHHGSDHGSLLMLPTLSRNSTDDTQNVQNRAINTRLIPPLSSETTESPPFMDDIALSQESDGHLRHLVADGYSQFTVCSSHAVGGMHWHPCVPATVCNQWQGQLYSL